MSILKGLPIVSFLETQNASMADPALYLGVSALLIAIAGVVSRIKHFRSLCCTLSLRDGAAPSPIRRWMNSFARDHPEVVQIDLEAASEGILARRRALSNPPEPDGVLSTQV